MPIYHHQIESAEAELDQLKYRYLERWGWKYTCNTPGSYWMWRRDFAESDAKRKAWDEEHGAGKPGGPSISHPYGVITASTDLAISITEKYLDEQPELASEDAA